MELKIRQTGRASLDFLAKIGGSLGKLNQDVATKLREAGVSEDKLPDDLDERATMLEDMAAKIPTFQAANACREWYCEHHGQIAIDVFEDNRDEIKSTLLPYEDGPATLEANPDLELPPYWTDNVIHRTFGGWDGHAHMGFIHGEIVHRYLVSKIVSGDIYKHRRDFAQHVGQESYEKILEIGCSSGPFTLALAETFSEAEIWACDLSIRQLEQAKRNLNKAGRAVHFKRCSGAQTGFEAESFDLVTSYAILHELPADQTKFIFEEAFRVLKPGGTLAFADVPPYDKLSKLSQWQVDFGARNEGEPFWRESATLDVEECLASIGMVDIRRYGLSDGDYPFPFVTKAKKPIAN